MNITSGVFHFIHVYVGNLARLPLKSQTFTYLFTYVDLYIGAQSGLPNCA
jgi:hypothetical protein